MYNELTVSLVNSGALSLTSSRRMIAVAVLDKPYVGFPSISVAWIIRVYWDTFYSKHTYTHAVRKMGIKNKGSKEH